MCIYFNLLNFQYFLLKKKIFNVCKDVDTQMFITILFIIVNVSNKREPLN